MAVIDRTADGELLAASAPRVIRSERENERLKRKISKQQARKLAEFFSVPAGLFI